MAAIEQIIIIHNMNAANDCTSLEAPIATGINNPVPRAQGIELLPHPQLNIFRLFALVSDIAFNDFPISAC